MALSILNNVASLAAQNQLTITNAGLQKALFQLSSGSRINTGADDAAGLAIADGLHANITALTQSARNANDGVGELQVADGSLAAVTTLLNRAVTIATEAATGTVSDAQRVALDAEYTAIKAEIDRVGSKTNYNGGQVFTNNTLNVFLSDAGANSNSVIGVTTGSLSSTSVGLGGTQATATLSQAAVPATPAKAVLVGGLFVGNTQAQGTLTGGAFTGATAATDTLTGGNFTGGVAATDVLTGGHFAGAIAASDVLTGSNAWVGAVASTGALTLTGGTIANNDTVQVGNHTYTFKTALTGGGTTPDEVLIGANDQAALLNLQKAVNGTGSAGVDYGTGTAVNTGVIASGADATHVDFKARVDGVAGNAIASVYTGAAAAFAGATLAGGVAGNTVAVGGTTYTIVTALSTTATANEVVQGTEQVTLANLLSAVNQGAGSGTTYSTGTVANASVTASNATATTLTFTAKAAGTGGNAITGTANGGANFATPTFTGGTAANTVSINGRTYTFVSALSGVADEIQVGTSGVASADETTSLANLVAAVNGTGTAGTQYGFGTAINANVTGVASATSAAFTAKTTGVGGNGYTTGLTGGNGAWATANFAGGAAGESTTIAGQTYNFVRALTGAANEVLVGVTGVPATDETTTLANLVAAVNGAAGAGIKYGNGTLANASVTGVAAPTTAVFSARAAGPGGNALSASLVGGVGSYSSANFVGGAVADTVTIGTQTYTFVSALTGAANEVLTGTSGNVANDTTTSLAHLASAVNGTAGAGTTYGTGTLANASATAVAGTNTDTFLSKATGVGANGVATTTTGHGSFGAGTLTGATNGDTVTIGTQTYAFVAALSGGGNPNEVLVGVDEAHSLLNLVAAVNGAAGAGTVYGNNTLTNTSATAAATTPTTDTFTAIVPGVAGNSLGAAITGGHGSFGAGFTGGAAAIAGGGPAAPGDTVTVGTQTYTFAAAITPTSNTGDVLVGATNAESLANLAAAVNGSTGGGTTYARGTATNASATALATGTSIIFSAITGGAGGNSIASTTTGGDDQFTSTTFTGGGATINDLLTSDDATAALATINSAVQSVAALRGTIGATVNRLQSAAGVITNQVQNLTGAEDGVRAADIPSTVATLAKFSILEQTGISSLAQANQQQQLVLKLLQ